MSEPKIRVLSPAVVERIAAGEMVERPVSVVKELVENALDAGARAITVRVVESLDCELSVIDDGAGMSRQELELAVRHHATSKIRAAEDLHRLTTLGFRGEAIPSIGAVSVMTICTSAGEDAAATELELVGGEVLDVRPASRTRGTTVTVKDLFFNVPVRRRFQKTDRGELQLAMRLFSHLALANPAVRFVFERDGRETQRFEPAASLRERAAALHGREAAGRFLRVAREGETLSVRGLVGTPEDSRATRAFQLLSVNRRPVVSPLVGHATRLGYGDLLPRDRHPNAILEIEIDPALVDVNVHPTKREVKFARESEVFDAVRRAVADALTALARPGLVRERPFREHGPGEFVGDPVPAPGLWDAPPDGASERTGDAPRDAGPRAAPARPDEPKFWQLHRRYVFAQTQSGALVIDQHAAHERILYERALARLDGARPASQRMLVPDSIDLTSTEMELLEEMREGLEKLGFEIEPFGERSVRVRAIPDDVYGWERNGQLLRDVLDEFAAAGRSVREIRERIARSFSCRAAIKSGQELGGTEMRALVDQLFATTTPHGDPHGRPTYVQLKLRELDRRIGRA